MLNNSGKLSVRLEERLNELCTKKISLFKQFNFCYLIYISIEINYFREATFYVNVRACEKKKFKT